MLASGNIKETFMAWYATVLEVTDSKSKDQGSNEIGTPPRPRPHLRVDNVMGVTAIVIFAIATLLRPSMMVYLVRWFFMTVVAVRASRILWTSFQGTKFGQQQIQKAKQIGEDVRCTVTKTVQGYYRTFHTLRHDRFGLWLPSEVRALQVSLQQLENEYHAETSQASSWHTSNEQLKQELDARTAQIESLQRQMKNDQEEQKLALQEAQERHEVALQHEKDKVIAMRKELDENVRHHQDKLTSLQDENDVKLKKADQQFLNTLEQTKNAMTQAIQHSKDIQHNFESKVATLEQANTDLHRQLLSERAQVRELQEWVTEQEQSHDEQIRQLECQLGDVQSCFWRRQEQDQKRTFALHRKSILEQHVQYQHVTQVLMHLLWATMVTPREHGSKVGSTSRRRDGRQERQSNTSDLQRAMNRANLFVSQLETKTGQDFLDATRYSISDHNNGGQDDNDDDDDVDEMEEVNGTQTTAVTTHGISPSWDMSWQLDLFWREAWRGTILPLVSSVMFPHGRGRSNGGIGGGGERPVGDGSGVGSTGSSPMDDDDRDADLLAAKTSFLLKNFIASTLGFSSKPFTSPRPTPPPPSQATATVGTAVKG